MGASYLLVGADVGTRLRVRVRAVNEGGASPAANSISTAKVRASAAGLRLAKVNRDPRLGLARMRVKPRGRAKDRLRKRGRAPGWKAVVGFTPQVGATRVKQRSLTLKRR